MLDRDYFIQQIATGLPTSCDCGMTGLAAAVSPGWPRSSTPWPAFSVSGLWPFTVVREPPDCPSPLRGGLGVGGTRHKCGTRHKQSGLAGLCSTRAEASPHPNPPLKGGDEIGAPKHSAPECRFRLAAWPVHARPPPGRIDLNSPLCSIPAKPPETLWPLHPFSRSRISR
jgi:hypothetical protein